MNHKLHYKEHLAVVLMGIIACRGDYSSMDKRAQMDVTPDLQRGTLLRVNCDMPVCTEITPFTVKAKIVWREGSSELDLQIDSKGSENYLEKLIPPGERVWVTFWVDESQGPNNYFRSGEWQLVEKKNAKAAANTGSIVALSLSEFRRENAERAQKSMRSPP